MRHFPTEKNSKIQVFFTKKFCAFRALDIAPLDFPVLFFFRQPTDLIVYVTPFKETTKTTQAKSGKSEFSAKGRPFHFLTFFT